MRDIIASGRVTRYHAYVIGVRLNGALVQGPEVRAPASQITYDVQPVDTDHQFLEETVQDVPAHNRRPQNVVVQAAKVGDYVELIKFDIGTPTPFAMHLYVRTEHEIFVNCQNQQVPP